MRGIPRTAVHKNLPVYGTDYTAPDIAEPNNICEWNPDMYDLNPKHEGAKAYYDCICNTHVALIKYNLIIYNFN